MAEPVIQVQGLGKNYEIRHNPAGGASYATLREALAGAVRALPRRLFNGPSNSATREQFWALRDVSFEVQPGEKLYLAPADRVRIW